MDKPNKRMDTSMSTIPPPSPFSLYEYVPASSNRFQISKKTKKLQPVTVCSARAMGWFIRWIFGGYSVFVFIHAMFAFVHDAFPLLGRHGTADDTRARGRADGQLAGGVFGHFRSLHREC